jgi:hypothetical protein
MSARHQPSHTVPPEVADETTALLLTPDELAELTGTRQPGRQRRWLEQNRWPYVNAVGRRSHPRVARAVFLDRMRNPLHGKSSTQPQLNALDRLARRRSP